MIAARRPPAPGRRPGRGLELDAMQRLLPIRAALAAAGLAALAAWGPPVLGFYLTVVACAGLMGAALVAYLRMVDALEPARVVELAVCTLAGLMVVVDAAVRFPALLGPGAPPAAGQLARMAFGVAVAGWIGPAVAPAVHDLSGRRRWRRARRAAAELSRRSARAVRRIADVT
jgi:hypothetical protein